VAGHIIIPSAAFIRLAVSAGFSSPGIAPMAIPWSIAAITVFLPEAKNFANLIALPIDIDQFLSKACTSQGPAPPQTTWPLEYFGILRASIRIATALQSDRFMSWNFSTAGRANW
jgi:hypothetical protein